MESDLFVGQACVFLCGLKTTPEALFKGQKRRSLLVVQVGPRLFGMVEPLEMGEWVELNRDVWCVRMVCEGGGGMLSLLAGRALGAGCSSKAGSLVASEVWGAQGVGSSWRAAEDQRVTKCVPSAAGAPANSPLTHS